MGYAISELILAIIGLVSFLIIAAAVLSWLIAFDVINTRNRFVGQVAYFLESITRPILEPFRRVIPTLGGVDISPIVVLLLLGFVGNVFRGVATPALIAALG